MALRPALVAVEDIIELMAICRGTDENMNIVYSRRQSIAEASHIWKHEGFKIDTDGNPAWKLFPVVVLYCYDIR